MRLSDFVCFCLVGAASVVCAQGRALQIMPSADAYIAGGKSSTENHGSESTFLVRNASNSAYNRVGYVQFSIGEIEAGKQIASASFKVRLSSVYRGRDEPSTLQVYGLKQVSGTSALGVDWKEDLLVDNNAPVSSKSARQVPSSAATLLGEFTVPPVGAAKAGQEFRVTGKPVVDYIDQMRKEGGKFVTFILVEKDVTKNSVAFIAKENSSFQGSTLDITLQ